LLRRKPSGGHVFRRGQARALPRLPLSVKKRLWNPRKRLDRWISSSTPRACPECGSRDYVFRGRKNVPAEGGHPLAIETKYACKACLHCWKERVVVKEAG
jgi:hypothetical protein